MKRGSEQAPVVGAAPTFPEEEAFGGAARRMAGLAGLAFGWPPETFWRATPAELGALVETACAGEARADPPDRSLIARLMEAFPDG